MCLLKLVGQILTYFIHETKAWHAGFILGEKGAEDYHQ